jgi:hypothetical protein
MAAPMPCGPVSGSASARSTFVKLHTAASTKIGISRRIFFLLPLRPTQGTGSGLSKTRLPHESRHAAAVAIAKWRCRYSVGLHVAGTTR